MGMGNVNALVGVVLALAASRRRQTPHVAPTCAKPTAPSRAAPRPLRPGVPVRRDGQAGGTAVRVPGPPCRRARKSVVLGKRLYVRVDLGGRRIIKKKKTK